MTMTEKENLMRVINGLEPEWLPRMGVLFYKNDPENHKPSCINAMPSYLPPRRSKKGGRVSDFGIEYEPTASMGGQELPIPNDFILDDITRWRDVIKAPSLEGVDWESVAKKAIAHVDRKESAVELRLNSNFFSHVMNFMGFTEGLCALQEEPDEVLALNEYMADYFEKVALNLVDLIKPDICGMSDDNSTARSPFISNEMYKRLFKPFHMRMAKIAMDRNIPIDMHDCGRCEDFIEDWRDFGVKLWNPAQISNDLPGIKKKYGKSLVLVGCWDSQGPASWPWTSEEVIRQAVRDCIDAYAPDGGFCFWGSIYGHDNDPRAKDHALWVTDEYNKYGRAFYKRLG